MFPFCHKSYFLGLLSQIMIIYDINVITKTLFQVSTEINSIHLSSCSVNLTDFIEFMFKFQLFNLLQFLFLSISLKILKDFNHHNNFVLESVKRKHSANYIFQSRYKIKPTS